MMKQAAFIYGCLVTTLYLIIACFPLSAQNSKFNFDCREQLFPKKDKATRLYGYVDITGEFKVMPTFLKAYLFDGQYAIVQKGKQFGIIDCSGNLSLPASYDDITGLYNGKAWIRQGQKWGLASGAGRILVTPSFDSVTPLAARSDFAWYNQKGLWGLFDKEAVRIVLEARYDKYQNLTDSVVFGRRDIYTDVIDLATRQVLHDSIEEVKIIGRQFFAGRKRGKWFLFNQHGQMTRADMKEVSFDPYFIACTDTKTEVLNMVGKPVMTGLEDVRLTQRPIFIAKKNNRYGLYNREGKMLYNKSFTKLAGPFGNMVLVSDGENYGIISAKADSVPTHFTISNYESIKNGEALLLTSNGGSALYSTAKATLVTTGITEVKNVRAPHIIAYSQANARILFNLNNGASQAIGSLEGVSGAGKFVFDRTPGKAQVLSSETLKPILSGIYQDVKPDSVSGEIKGFICKTNEGIDYYTTGGKRIEAVSGKYQKIYQLKTDRFVVMEKGTTTLIDSKGQQFWNEKSDSVILDPLLAMAGYYLVMKQRGFELLDERGNKVLEQIKEPEYLGYGLMKNIKDGKLQVTNLQGKVFSLPDGTATLKPFSEKLAPFEKGGKYGFLTQQMAEAISAIYDSVGSFWHGHALVKLNGKYGLINNQGRPIVTPKYDHFNAVAERRYRFY